MNKPRPPVTNREITLQKRAMRQRWGHMIYQARRAQGLTLQQLARLTRIPAKRLDRMEVGKGALDMMMLARLYVILEIEG